MKGGLHIRWYAIKKVWEPLVYIKAPTIIVYRVLGNHHILFLQNTKVQLKVYLLWTILNDYLL